jgi:phosphatidylserine/phosphatidylglycerophosphate/cardiolipin synthase-like enzyme
MYCATPNKGLMHHKVMIIDESVVVFCSNNFTNSAETKKDENLIVIYNEEIAAQFMDEFHRVYAQVEAAQEPCPSRERETIITM